MTKRRIHPHKGGRTARAPEARIRPQTLAAIHAEMREQGKSFADLVEEEYSQGDDRMATKVICPRCGYEIEIDATGIGLCERDQIWVKPANDGTNDGVFASNYDVVEDTEKYASKK